MARPFPKRLLVFVLLGSMTLPVFSVKATTYTSTQTITGANGLVIDGDTFSASSGQCLRIYSSTNVTIRNSTFQNCTAGFALLVNGSSNVTIRNNTFLDSFAWISAQVTTGGIVITKNTFSNQMLTGGSTAGGIQFNQVAGAGNEISYNTITNNVTSVTEDNISLYRSNGMLASPIIVKHNCVTGVTSNPSGSGINIGDDGGSWVVVDSNFVKDAGAGGIGVSAGTNMVVMNNLIWQTGRPGVNGSLVIKNFYSPTRVCDQIDTLSNRIDYTNALGNKVDGWYGTIWNPTNCTNVTNFSTNNFNDTLSDTTCATVLGDITAPAAPMGLAMQ